MALAIAALAGRLPGPTLVAGPAVSAAASGLSGWVLDPAHPLPDRVGVEAGREALAIAAAARASGDPLLVLLSGGASAMLCAPAEGLTLDDKSSTVGALMHAGVGIDALNCVRRHLSAIKGGRLAAAAGRSVTLAISDVHYPVADDPSVIGSGPTVPDRSTFAEALAIAGDVASVPGAALQHLRRGAAGEIPETVKPGDPRLDRSRYELIGNRLNAISHAARCAASLGYAVEVIGEPTNGEARDAARDFLRRAAGVAASRRRPLCVVAAGETTVRVRGRGRGGRNQEFALAAAADRDRFASLGRAALASAGTDGIDGPTDAAGAIVDNTTLARARAAGLSWDAALDDNDSYLFFEALRDLIVTGPTGTNVGDVQILLIA